MDTISLRQTEKIMYALRSLYESYGYTQYRMGKFEEYDLYVKNKSFLLSDHIIAFTDTDGKLMALKPDVTLSIVKNSPEREDGVRRVYYNENVYRVPKGGFSYKEIMQTGLECIGEIDTYSLVQVLSLAAKSLEEISGDFVLDISHLGIISALIDGMVSDRDIKEKLIVALGEKNIHTIDALCKENSVDAGKADMLRALVSMKGDCCEMLSILDGSNVFSEARELADIVNILKETYGDKVRIDFSVVDDMRYYNGIIFKGFVKGIPSSLLSGGRYDKLMERMGKKSGAVGFAIYLDLLDELELDGDAYDGDVFVRYGEKTSLTVITSTVDELVKSGKRVDCGKVLPEKKKYREIKDI